MVTFKSRDVGNQPEVLITGHSIDHVLSSRYFRTYDCDKKFEVVEEDHLVKIRASNTNDSGMVIGYMDYDI